MKSINRALVDAANRLKGSDTPRLDAELLLAEALGIDRDRLLLDPPARDVPDRFWAMIERRAAGEPVAYITGRRAFWNIDLHVGPGVLIPRPDSEVLIESAIGHFDGTSGPARILDLGTGPGTLLLAALDVWGGATGLGVDMSRRALSYAAANSRRLGFELRVTWRIGDWADGIDEAFDLVLINPPYVAESAETGPGVADYEPAEALFAGADGLDDYRRIAPVVGRLIAPGGLAAIEIGHDQAESAAVLFANEGHLPWLAHDLAGRPRALLIAP